jgi:CHAT domain-containing protein
VRELISTRGAFDLLHFAGHGSAETDAISEARLLLQGRMEQGRYIEAPFTTTTVSSRSNLMGADGSRPLVVLNACQAGRLGYALTGIGGFAQAFLDGGAGAFIGTQWSVGDVPSRVFTETFYRRMLDGATVAEATVASRERARADGDATWLAYAVYAHPHARLERPGAH